jgi:hypothetical protein
MIGYAHNSKTLWRIWNPESQSVKVQSQVLFDAERNAHMSYLYDSNAINRCELAEVEKYVDKANTGDEHIQDH